MKKNQKSYKKQRFNKLKKRHNQKNNIWKGVLKEVPVYKDGQKIKYTVEEDEVRGYTGEIKETDTGFEIINTKIPPEKIELPLLYVKKDPPATAVETINMLPLIAGDLVVLGFILKKRK